jgi:hypothetical protein
MKNLLPIFVFIIVTLVYYYSSNEPDRNKKPIKYLSPGLLSGFALFIYTKYKKSAEPLMEGNYFD